MSRLTGRRALITGASSGVGRALAVRLARCGVDSVVFARSGDALAETANLAGSRSDARCLPYVGDVTSPDARAAAVDLCEQELGGLDLLVNNAGVGAEGRFEDASTERFRSVLEVNLLAAVELTREALPLLERGDAACVACVGSVLAWCGAPQKAEYAASKHALRGWCDSVRPELRRLGVHVLHASPSTINTGFRDHGLEAAEDSPWPKRRGVSPERVARRIVRGIERRRNEVSITWEDWAVVRLARFAPWVLDRALRRCA